MRDPLPQSEMQALSAVVNGTTLTLDQQIDAVLERMGFGEATARKAGRDPAWPYVPIIKYPTHTYQIRNRAFTTRKAAVECAQAVIDKQRETTRTQFKTPRYRAYRQQWGLPVEIEETAS